MIDNETETAINDAHCLLAQNMTYRALGLEALAQQDETKRFRVIAQNLIRDDWIVDTDEWRDWLASRALAGSPPAHEALCKAAKFLLQDDKPLPPWLGWYLLDVAREGGVRRAKRGRKKVTSERNIAISWAIYIIGLRYDLHPTRNIATTTECGCSIVAKALKRYNIILSEANVAAIWQSSRRWIEERQGAGKPLPPEADPSFKLELPLPEPIPEANSPFKWVRATRESPGAAGLSRSRRRRRLHGLLWPIGASDTNGQRQPLGAATG